MESSEEHEKFPQAELVFPQDLKPSPLKLVKKPGNTSIKSFLPSSTSFHPTDLTTCKCEGFLFGNGAVISVPEHVWALILLGAYGKGSFSRSIPCHNHVPTPVDLKQRKRKSPANSARKTLKEWEKRIKLHSHWKSEQESGWSGCDDDLLPTLSSFDEHEEIEYKDFICVLDKIKGRDPYVIDEYLQLGSEETFYLSGELKVLEICSHEASTPLIPTRIWAILVEDVPSFPYKYAAYKHYREGYWVPKSGLKFGVDFLLYKTSPMHFHSSFAVLVRGNRGYKDSQSWKDIVTVTRTCQATGKDLLLCDVTFPEGVDINVPTCIDHVTVVDTIVKWWVPEQDREM